VEDPNHPFTTIDQIMLLARMAVVKYHAAQKVT